jgi:filamentous hemagglutinin family protein
MFHQYLTVRISRTERSRASSICFATMTAVAALLIAQRTGLAGPTGGSVVEGSAGISQSGSVTNVNQSTNKAIINWQGFSIGANETVNFNQPGRSSVTLNRVIGNETSVISGALNANGQVFIVNSAGVLFGKNAQVNVGGLVASTLDISNANFMAGNYTFSGTSTASVVNQGTIHAHGGGYVALLGNTVSNDGVIAARLGTVAMAAGSQITLNFGGNALLDVTIDRGTLNALVENKRAIIANGGQVIMTAKAADTVLSAQVNNSGIIQARSMAALTGGSGKTRAARTGSIKLIADGGTTTVTGTLDASAPKGGDGGSIETSGNKVKIADSAVITTKAASGQSGTWLLDPDGYTVAASGGDMTGASLSNWLATNGAVTIASTNGNGTDGNININDAVSWSTNSILTLNATNNVNINAPIDASGTNARLVMNYGGFAAKGTATAGSNYNINMASGGSVTLAGANAALQINGVTYTLIHSMKQLAALSASPSVFASGHYALAQNLAPASDPTSTYQFTSPVIASLTGTLAGLGHTITGLTITNTSALAPNTGLIGTARAGSTIRDLGLIGATVTETQKANTSNNGVGVLVGVSSANISQVYVDSTSRVTGAIPAGGLIGVATGSVTISDSYSGAAVATTTSDTGGLIGKATNVNIVRSYATGDVTGTTSNGGGLIGLAANVNITDSYATGDVTGTAGSNGVGGLVGNASTSAGAAAIVNSFASGNVRGGDGLGGLVGVLAADLGDFTVENSHATGDVSSVGATVSSPSGIGGLIGFTTGNAGRKITIENDYATGAVGFFAADGVTPAATGNNAGGLLGTSPSGSGVTTLIDNSHATGKVTGSLTGSGVGGLVGAGGDPTDSISNSYATGDVSGNTSVGGLAGSNEGTITNSYATGNVTGYNSTSSNNIGGLVGSNVGSIANSHADGNVNGEGPNAATGGLVGSNGGSIADSYASGTVTGPSGLTGGIAGVSFNNSGKSNNTTAGSISNSWFNSDKNPGLSMTNSLACCKPGVVTGGGGLTNTQFADIKFYLNGTINQVLAERAAEAAAKAAAEAAAKAAAQTRQAASRTADTVASNAATSAATPPDPASSAAGTPAATSASAAKIDDTIKTIKDSVNADDERARRRVAAAAASTTRRGHGTGGSDLGATIRSIEVDGQRFDLKNGGKKDAPGQKPQ